MPETGSAQGALPLRSAYPARDLTHSKGRRTISPDKTTGSFKRRFVPESGVLHGKGKMRLFFRPCPYSLPATPGKRRRRDRNGISPCGLGRNGRDFPASFGECAPFISHRVPVQGKSAQSVLAIFRRAYTLGEEDEECPDVDLLSRSAVFSGSPVGGFFLRGPPSAGQRENEAAMVSVCAERTVPVQGRWRLQGQPAGVGSLGAESLPLDAKAGKPVFLIQEARPSFCSSACYLLLLKALEIWNYERSKPVISERAWLALMPRIGQHDGDGPWGWANANGPGFAMLVHSLGAGVNFEDWSPGPAGRFHEDFLDGPHRPQGIRAPDGAGEGWRRRGDFLVFQRPDGYGSKTVPKSKIKRVIFTRITRPERFNLAPSIGHNAWLASLLKQDVSMKEVRSHCGMKEP